ncbi:TPA: hypothetical protein DCW61_01520 [Candidatus Uhrbacteria bacterium]|nr:hypothetical protein [Candidatus Uhrbacteria bacterium]
MTVSKFITYCTDRDVKIKKEDLEFFDEKNIVVPAIGIYRPIIRQKNSAGQLIYMFGGIGTSIEGEHFNYFGFDAKGYRQKKIFRKKNRETCRSFQPALTVFVPWKKYRDIEINSAKHKKDLGKSVELFYSPEQIFAVTYALQSWHLNISGAALLKNAKEWEKTVRVTKTYFDKRNGGINETIVNHHRMISLFYDAEDLWFNTVRKKIGWFEKNADSLDPVDFESSMERWQESYKIEEVEQLLIKHKISKIELRKLIEPFIYTGFDIDPNIEIWECYRELISISWIKKQKGLARFCEDYYRIARRLLWLLKSFENQLVTIKDYYQTRGWKIGINCLICKKPIIKTKTGGRRQITCAKKECEKELDKRRKKTIRKKP